MIDRVAPGKLSVFEQVVKMYESWKWILFRSRATNREQCQYSVRYVDQLEWDENDCDDWFLYNGNFGV